MHNHQVQQEGDWCKNCNLGADYENDRQVRTVGRWEFGNWGGEDNCCRG